MQTNLIEPAHLAAEFSPTTPAVSDAFSAPRRGRIRRLDGLRGVAILLVLLVHFTPDVAMPARALEWLKKMAQAGWVGVDLFFVLSGFLITSILLDSKSHPLFFRNFYMRRTLRIFPLYYTAVAASLFLAPAFLQLGPSTLEQLRSSAPWLWGYCANIGWFLQGTVGVPWPSDEVRLVHFWSLSVEEHFYLLWPIVIYFCPMRQLPWVCLGMFLLSLTTRCAGLLVYDGNSPFFYTTICRLDGLAAGAFLAVIARRMPLDKLAGVARITVAIGATILTAFFVTQKGLWPGHWFMRSIGLTCLVMLVAACLIIILSSPKEGAGARLFENGMLRFFGKYSYGLYVIHSMIAVGLERLMPIEWWLRTTGSPVLSTLGSLFAKVSISTLLAVASWHLLEKHFLDLKRHFA